MTLSHLALSLGAVVALVLLAALVRFLATIYHLSAEWQRKLIHIAVGLASLCLPLFLDHLSFGLFAIFALLALLGLRLPLMQKWGGAAVHSVQRKSWGDLLILVTVATLFFLAAGDPLFYTLPIATITLADSAAALYGSRYGKHKFYMADEQKSLEGSAMFFIITLLLSLGVIYYDHHLPLMMIVPISILLSTFATIIEASSWRGFDNVFVPFAMAAFWVLWTGAERSILCLTMLLFVVILLSVVLGTLGFFKNVPHPSYILAIISLVVVGGSLLRVVFLFYKEVI